MLGPGKYDDLCTHVREQAHADGVVLIIANGARGSGFSVQAPIDVHAALPAVLESLAESIRADWTARDNAGPMTDYHTAAFTLLTLGKAAGLLSRDDIRSRVLDGLRAGSLNPEYLVLLRDQLADVLREAEQPRADAS
jgi:hypothetical protein